MQKRKQYFIDRQFQTRFILKFCLINIAASILIGALIYVLNGQTKTVAFENLSVVAKSTSDFILPIMLEVIVIVTAFVALSTIAIALLASHRISGPLYRLTQELDSMRSGDLSRPIRIRTRDQLGKFADECEDFRLEYQKSIGLIQKSWKQIQSGVDKEKNSSVLSSELSKFKTE